MNGGCHGKVRYPTRNIAKLAMKRARGAGGTQRRAYRCPECGLWHLSKHTATVYSRRIRGGE